MVEPAACISGQKAYFAHSNSQGECLNQIWYKDILEWIVMNIYWSPVIWSLFLFYLIISGFIIFYTHRQKKSWKFTAGSFLLVVVLGYAFFGHILDLIIKLLSAVVRL